MFLGIYLFLLGCPIYLVLICLAAGLFEFILVETLCFLYLDICFLLQVWEVFSHNFIKYIFYAFLSLSLPSGALVIQILRCLILLQRSLKLSSFLKICFSFPCSDRGISIILSSTSLMHVSPNLLLSSTAFSFPLFFLQL